jgi:membrane-bound metal-dependent hydrolase YbcI (DUF457 family)
MRVFEIVGTIGLLLCGLLLPFFSGESAFALLVVIITLVVGCHVLREGWRLQMAPAYCSLIILIVYECQHRLWAYQAPEIAS